MLEKERRPLPTALEIAEKGGPPHGQKYQKYGKIKHEKHLKNQMLQEK